MFTINFVVVWRFFAALPRSTSDANLFADVATMSNRCRSIVMRGLDNAKFLLENIEGGQQEHEISMHDTIKSFDVVHKAEVHILVDLKVPFAK